MARKARAAKGNTVRVNFKGVESRKTPPEGDYILEVLEANSKQSGAGNDQIEFIFEIAKGEYKGVKCYFYCPLAENSLWKLHALLTAMGEDVPEDDMDIDLSDLVGKEIVGVLTHETYQGKKRHKMTDFDSVDNYSGDDADDEKPAKGKKAKPEPEPKGKKSTKEEPKGKKKKRTWTTEEIEDLDVDELQEVLEEAGLEDDVDLDDYPKLKKKIAAVIDALEDEDLIDDD